MLWKKLIFFFLFFSIFISIKDGIVKKDPIEMEFLVNRWIFYLDINKKEFSEELLKQAIFYERIQNPEIVLLQAYLETGFFTSDIFLNGHNCFGMKYPKFRATVAIGEYQGHAKYNSWWDSVIDYAIWQKWYLSKGYKIETFDSDAYLVFLNCIRYAEDPHYIRKLVYLKDIS